MTDLAHLAFHHVEVVEQPIGRGRDRLATPHVAGEDAIRVTEYARVIRQAAQEPGWATSRVSRQREFSGQRPGAFFEALDTKEFAVQGTCVEANQLEARPARMICGTGRGDASAWRQLEILPEWAAGCPWPD